MTDCLFCKIVAGEIPASKVYEDEHTLAFMDINPATRGHLLVIPKQHAENLYEINEQDLARCSQVAKQLATRLRDKLGADGINLLNSCGSDAWQTVFHFHIHVIPRYKSDPLKLPWVPTAGDMDEIGQVAAELA